jgi:hypothetical protein
LIGAAAFVQIDEVLPVLRSNLLHNLSFFGSQTGFPGEISPPGCGVRGVACRFIGLRQSFNPFQITEET